MGDCIMSSLSVAHPAGVASVATDQPGCDNQTDPSQQCLDDRTSPESFGDEVAVEIIAVTDYAEVVELGTSAEDAEAATEGNRFERTVTVEDVMEMLPGQPIEVLRVRWFKLSTFT